MSFCRPEWNALLRIWVFALDDDNKFTVQWRRHELGAVPISWQRRRHDTINCIDKSSKSLSSSANKICFVITNWICRRRLVRTSPNYWIFLELPNKSRLNDMANLLNLDSKNLDVKQLGIDAIKDQHRINKKFTSNQCAIIPEDTAQIMLTGVSTSHFLSIRMCTL